MINQEDNHRIRNVYLVLYQPEKMLGVVDKLLQGILLLGPSNILHILPIGKVSQACMFKDKSFMEKKS